MAIYRQPLPVTLVVGSSYELMMSVSPDRSSPVPLDGETVGGTIYGFVSPETGISKVSFYLDDPNMTGSPFQVENSGPWDIGGTASNGDSLPYDTTLLSDESHTITAAIELSDGGTDVASATFTVDNNGPALVFSPEAMTFSVDEGGTGTGSAGLDTNDGTVADYTLAGDVSWLTVSPLTSSTPQMLTLSVDATGLASGTYTAAVTASADGYLSANLPVTLVVGSGYDLMMSVSPDRSSPVLLDGQTVAGTMESVLVVATDPERALLVAILTRAGYATIEAREGAAGARKILDRSPTIIVMAEEVPPVNGIGYLPFVRHLTDALIVVVGHGGESSVSRALFQGADAYVTRPIDDSELLARFNSLRRRERSQASESRGQTARPPP